MRRDLAMAAVALAAVLLSCGCASTPQRDQSSLQGTWVGEEIGGEKGECRMTIQGDSIRFQGARRQDWYVGTLTLTPSARPMQAAILIEACPFPQYINKTSKAIYQFKGKVLTITGNEPGNEAAPTAFGRNPATQTRAFAFTRQ